MARWGHPPPVGLVCVLVAVGGWLRARCGARCAGWLVDGAGVGRTASEQDSGQGPGEIQASKTAGKGRWLWAGQLGEHGAITTRFCVVFPACVVAVLLVRCDRGASLNKSTQGP